MLLRLVRRIPWAASLSATGVGVVAQFVMIVVIFGSVVARYAFNRPFSFVEELSGYLMATVSVAALAYAVRTGSHIIVDIMVKWFPRRASAYLKAVTLLLSMGFVIFLFAGAIAINSQLFRSGQVSVGPMRMSLGSIHLIVSIGFGIFALQIVAEVISKVRLLLQQEGAGRN